MVTNGQTKGKYEHSSTEVPMHSWSAVLVIFGAAILLAIAYLFIYFVLAERVAARSGITDADKLASFKDSFTKTLAQIIAGVAVTATFAWTFIKDSDTLRQTSLQAANQRFVDAAKLMGTTEVDTRSAGIFSFRQLVEAYPDYYSAVSATLQEFIQRPRSNLTYPKGARPPRVDGSVRAATFVLGKLPPPEDVSLRFVDDYLVGANFTGAISLVGADFQGAILYATNFTWARLENAKFNGASMSDWQSYGWADEAWDQRLLSAKNGQDGGEWVYERFRYLINFDHADLTGATFIDTSVSGASFRSARLVRTNFSNTDISRTDFTDAEGIDSIIFTGACFGGTDDKPVGLGTDILSKLRSPCS
jgi:uncharacterized protein YjbI with pentapeptide repeats